MSENVFGTEIDEYKQCESWEVFIYKRRESEMVEVERWGWDDWMDWELFIGQMDGFGGKGRVEIVGLLTKFTS